jgi:hypothetical protein
LFLVGHDSDAGEKKNNWALQIYQYSFPYDNYWKISCKAIKHTHEDYEICLPIISGEWLLNISDQMEEQVVFQQNFVFSFWRFLFFEPFVSMVSWDMFQTITTQYCNFDIFIIDNVSFIHFCRNVVVFFFFVIRLTLWHYSVAASVVDMFLSEYVACSWYN